MTDVTPDLSYLDRCPRLLARFCQCGGIDPDSEYGQSLIERSLTGHLCKCPPEEKMQMIRDTKLFLSDLIDKINAAHSDCEQAFSSSLSHARQVGEYLIEAKAQLERGAWSGWVAENCKFSIRTAQKYMRIAANWDELKASSTALLSIEGALEAIAEPAPAEAEELSGDQATNQPKNTPENLTVFKPASDPDTIEQGLKEGWIQSIARATEPILNFRDEPDPAPTSSTVEVQQKPSKLAVHHSSDSAEHYTPKEVIDAVIECLGAIDLDPCSNSHHSPNVPAAQHLTKDDDGLGHIWRGRVYMNPPYGRVINDWVEKLCLEHECGNVSEAIALLPARVDTQWWRRLRDYPVCFVEGRLTFDGNTNAAPFPSAIVYLGEDVGTFYNCFAELGDVWQRIEPGMFCE